MPIAKVTQEALLHGQVSIEEIAQLIAAEHPENPLRHRTPNSRNLSLSSFYRTAIAHHLTQGTWSLAKASLRRLLDRHSQATQVEQGAKQDTAMITAFVKKLDLPVGRLTKTRSGKSFILGAYGKEWAVYNLNEQNPIWHGPRPTYSWVEDNPDGTVALKLKRITRNGEGELETVQLSTNASDKVSFRSRGTNLPGNFAAWTNMIQLYDPTSIMPFGERKNAGAEYENRKILIHSLSMLGENQPLFEGAISFAVNGAHPQILELTDGTLVAAGAFGDEANERYSVIYYPPFKGHLTSPETLQSAITRIEKIRVFEPSPGRIFVSALGDAETPISDRKVFELYEPAVSSKPIYEKKDLRLTLRYDAEMFERDGELYLLWMEELTKFSLFAPFSKNAEEIAHLSLGEEAERSLGVGKGPDGNMYFLLRGKDEITNVYSLFHRADGEHGR